MKVVGPPAAPGPPLLAEFDNGVGAVATGRTAPVWHEPDGVAALDGTSVFSVRNDDGTSADRLVRLDPKTGVEMAAWALPARSRTSPRSPRRPVGSRSPIGAPATAARPHATPSWSSSTPARAAVASPDAHR